MDAFPTTFVTLPLVFQDHSTEDTFGGIAAALRALLAARLESSGGKALL